jgi:signal transduction histidine kinase
VSGPEDCPPRSYWERMSVGWHLVFFGLVAMTAVLVALDDGVTSTQRVVDVVVLTALAGWYWLLGRHGMTDQDYSRRWSGPLYLSGLYAACWVVIATSQVAYLLLFLAFPHTWGILERTRDALIASAVLVTGLVVGMAGSSGWTGRDLAVASLIGVVQLCLSGLLGLWINGITAESQKRARLIQELERTQAELGEVSHQAGVLAERERLAADIHDTLAQGFTSVLMLVQAAEADLDEANLDPAGSGEIRRHLALARQTARENLAEARSLVAVLAPATLDGGLPGALSRLVDRIGDELGIRARIAIEGQPWVLPANREVIVLRAAQEALANVRKHADAATLSVTLSYGDCGTELRVCDDGRGFDQGEPSQGYGLAGMRSRLEQVGGSLAIDSGPTRGTTVRAVVPA